MNNARSLHVGKKLCYYKYTIYSIMSFYILQISVPKLTLIAMPEAI